MFQLVCNSQTKNSSLFTFDPRVAEWFWIHLEVWFAPPFYRQLMSAYEDELSLGDFLFHRNSVMSVVIKYSNSLKKYKTQDLN